MIQSSFGSIMPYVVRAFKHLAKKGKECHLSRQETACSNFDWKGLMHTYTEEASEAAPSPSGGGVHVPTTSLWWYVSCIHPRILPSSSKPTPCRNMQNVTGRFLLKNHFTVKDKTT
jgi:hypothetical protein